MARLTGLEPATPGVTGRYSNQLSYNRVQPPGPKPEREGVLGKGLSKVKQFHPQSCESLDFGPIRTFTPLNAAVPNELGIWPIGCVRPPGRYVDNRQSGMRTP